GDLDDMHVPDLAVLVAREEFRLLLDRCDGRAQADPHEISPGLLAEALQANRKQRTPLRGADLVDLVEDDPFDVREVFAELRRAQDDRDALRRCDEDVRRVTDLSLALLGRGIAGANADADEGFRLALFLRQFREFVERLLQVAVDIVREGLERGDVQTVDSMLELAAQLLRVELVDDGQEGRERLPAPGGGGDQDVLSSVD